MLKSAFSHKLKFEAFEKMHFKQKRRAALLFDENNTLPKISKIFHIISTLSIYTHFVFMPCTSSTNLRAANPFVNLRAGESCCLSLRAAYCGKFHFSFEFYIILFF